MRKNVCVFVLMLAVMMPNMARADDLYETRMLDDLLKYIYCSEMMYSDVLWVLDSFERFDRKKTWDNLLIARAALSIAMSDMKMRKLPEPSMTAEDEAKFMKRGIDMSFLDNLGFRFEAEKTSQMNTCANLLISIMYRVFFKEDWEIAKRHSAEAGKEAELEIRSLANMADWVLTSLNNPDTTRKFNALLAEHCPQTHARLRKKPATPQEIEASLYEILDQINASIVELAKISGAMRNRVNVTKYGLEKKDTGVISSSRINIAGMPPVVRCPKWLADTRLLKNAELFYYWKKDDGSITRLKPRMEIQRIPDGCYISVRGVSLEEVKAYQKSWEEIGLPCLWSTEKEGRLTMLFRMAGREFAVDWENGTAKIMMSEKQVCFAPVLYISMMHSTMN